MTATTAFDFSPVQLPPGIDAFRAEIRAFLDVELKGQIGRAHV